MVGDLEIDEDLRDDTHDAASGGEAGFGYSRHEANSSSAIDKADVSFGESAAELLGCFTVDGIGSAG